MPASPDPRNTFEVTVPPHFGQDQSFEFTFRPACPGPVTVKIFTRPCPCPTSRPTSPVLSASTTSAPARKPSTPLRVSVGVSPIYIQRMPPRTLVSRGCSPAPILDLLPPDLASLFDETQMQTIQPADPDVVSVTSSGSDDESPFLKNIPRAQSPEMRHFICNPHILANYSQGQPLLDTTFFLALFCLTGTRYTFFRLLQRFPRIDPSVFMPLCSRDPGAVRLDNFFSHMSKTAEQYALKLNPTIDYRSLLWTFQSLDEDSDLEKFFECLPRLFDLETGKSLNLLQGTHEEHISRRQPSNEKDEEGEDEDENKDEDEDSGTDNEHKASGNIDSENNPDGEILNEEGFGEL